MYKPLVSFIEESNKIENIWGSSNKEIELYEYFLSLNNINLDDIVDFVQTIANANLRDKPGMNVQVGTHKPIPGGPDVPKYLDSIISGIYNDIADSYESHLLYENLHPFMDGNGRSGRAIWAWHMRREGKDPFALGFLHTFYYQTLEHQR